MNYLPRSLVLAIEQQRVLPVVGLGVPDLVPSRFGHPWLPATREVSAESLTNWFDCTSEYMLPLYEALAAMRASCIIALTPDRNLFGFLSACESNWMAISRSSDYIDDQRSLLLQLAGQTDRTAKLLITDEDWLSVETRNPVPWELAKSHAARSPLLLVACDWTDVRVAELASELRAIRHFHTAGWIVCDHLDDSLRKRWSDLGFEIVQGPISSVVSELHSTGVARPNHSRQLNSKDLLRASPYKHLDYFEKEDASFFYGRENELRQLIDLICGHRLVIVAGPSGTGKTSLLKAGVLAWCDIHPPFVGIYSRCGEDPESSMLEAIRRQNDLSTDSPWQQRLMARLQRSSEEGRAENALTTELYALCGRHGPPLIVLDQAEELFTRFDSRLRDRFFLTIRTCLTDPNLPVRFVLSIRDDFLSRLVEMRPLLPSMLQNTFYVAPLSRASGIAAIRQPSLQMGVAFDEKLADQILDEIAGERVAPPQIQIVCDCLYRRRNGDRIDSTLYSSLGGARSILGHFMEQQLTRLGDGAELARQVLKAMVTSEGTKEVLSHMDVARRARCPEPDVRLILIELRDTCRLVRSLFEGNEQRFELAHEYLTFAIWQWMTQEERDRREIDELLIKELRAWRQFHSIRLGPDRLNHFAHHVRVLEVDADALTLLLLSAVSHQCDTRPWIDKSSAMSDADLDIIAANLFDYFKLAEFNQRCEAAEVISQLEPGPLVRALGSAHERSRHAAIEMIGGIRFEAAVSKLGALMDHEDEKTAVLACGALGAVGGDTALALLVSAVRNRGGSNAVFAASLQALGRLGIPSTCFESLQFALETESEGLRRSAAKALEYGLSFEAVKHLLRQAKVSKVVSDIVWKSTPHLPRSCEAWFEEFANSLKQSQLRHIDTLLGECWVVYVIRRVYWRREPNLLSAAAPPPIENLLPYGCSVEVAAKVIENRFSAAIAELARRGTSVHSLVEKLAAYDNSSIRIAAAKILANQNVGVGDQFALRTAERLASDSSQEVVAAACVLAQQRKHWSLLERVVRSSMSGLGRGAALRGLADAVGVSPLSENVVRECLEGGDETERFWACIYSCKHRLLGLLDALRDLVHDQATPRGLQDLTLSRPDFGTSVATAARRALSDLSPSSKVWIEHLDWQQSFRSPK
jgi:HEAT repeat protein